MVWIFSGWNGLRKDEAAEATRSSHRAPQHGRVFNAHIALLSEYVLPLHEKARETDTVK
jgi:hypothetical protein